MSKVLKLLLNPRLLYIKIFRRIGYEYLKIKMRFVGKFNLDLRDIPLSLDTNFYGDLITKPGNSLIFDQVNAFGSKKITHCLENILKHKFKVFSDEYFSTNISNPMNLEAIAEIASEMPYQKVRDYNPIDWHCDFKTGYRWDDQLLYLDVPLSPVNGVDIKIPREMSRFQFIGEMFFADKEVTANEFFLQLIDWITANPIRRGVNWACTMDVAIRAVNWIWGIRFFEDELSRYPKIEMAIYKSLIEHGRHIYDNLEYYEECTGNHYLSNIAGLIYISARLPHYKDSDEWLLFGIQELISEIKRQVYSDGYSHEASTHYHRLVTEIFLSTSILVERIPVKRRQKLLEAKITNKRKKPPLRSAYENNINLESSGIILPSDFYKTLSLMVEFTAALTKPNGLVPQIGDNDSARLHKLLPSNDIHISDHSHILALGGELFNDDFLRKKGITSSFEADLIAGDFLKKGINLSWISRKNKKFFNKAGIGVLNNDIAWLCVSCGSNGQNQRGGHGHNDKNSFELNIEGHDYILDGGCPFYTSNPNMRNEYRSTFAHSTLSVSQKEQDEWKPGVAGLFILDEKSNPKLTIRSDGRIEGVHNGYGRKHVRTFNLCAKKLEITDYCAVKEYKYLSFNLSPKVSVKDISKINEDVNVILDHQNGRKIFIKINGVKDPQVIDGYYSEGFGCPIDNKMFKVQMSSYSAKTVLSW